MADVIRVEPIALMPTQAGCAIFLGDGAKVIFFYIDPGVGASINAVLANTPPERPLTHDLFLMTLEGFGAKVQRAVIHSMKDEVYFSRIIYQAENELMEKKIVEVDSRPSDAIALALRAQAPIYMTAELWHSLPNVSKTLEDMRKQASSDEV